MLSPLSSWEMRLVAPSVAALVLAGSWAIPCAGQTAATNGSCSDSLVLMVARGSGEPVGLGKIGVVALNVTALVPGTLVQAVEYPATIVDYETSVHAGASALSGMVERYVAGCPAAKIGLLGYSQGAHVAANVLCGNADNGEPTFAPLNDSLASHVVAVVMFGDPTHIAGLAWDAGTSKHNGIFPRQAPSLTSCQAYSSKMKSWCDAGDIFCDSGNDTSVHGSYFANYTTDAVGFIVSKFNETEGSRPGNGTSTSSPTGTPTASPSSRPTGNAAMRRSEAVSSVLGYVTALGMVLGSV